MKNQKIDSTTGAMEHVRLYHKCMAFKREQAVHCFPLLYKNHNGINERQQIYTLWRIFVDTHTMVSVNANIVDSTTASQKKNLFALLYELYTNGSEAELMGGFSQIIEDEVLFGKNPLMDMGILASFLKFEYLASAREA